MRDGRLHAVRVRAGKSCGAQRVFFFEALFEARS